MAIDTKRLWYDIGDILSYKCLLNFDTGARGTGKTYGYKKWALDDWEKTGAQFAYMRRYKTELKEVDKFFDDLPKRGLPLNVKGHTFYCGKEVIGSAIPLSIAISKKSVPYPGINKMLFDEFIIPPKGHIRYMPNEVFSFLEFYETVNRMRIDMNTGEELPLSKLLRVFFFANNVSYMNPYYMYFNCFPVKGKRFNRFGDDIVVGVYQNEVFRDVKSNTRFGKLVSGTPYGDYAIDNEVFMDKDSFIKERTNTSVYAFKIVLGKMEVGFWYDRANGWIFASNKWNNNGQMKFALTSEDHQENYFLITRASQDPFIKNLLQSFKHGHLFFENATVKAYTMQMLATLMTR